MFFDLFIKAYHFFKNKPDNQLRIGIADCPVINYKKYEILLNNNQMMVGSFTFKEVSTTFQVLN